MRDIELVIDAMRKASKLLRRDFFELENFQSTSTNNQDFCKKSYLRSSQTLHKELNKYYKNVIFNHNEFDYQNISDDTILVDIIDSFSNFERTIPYFATIVTLTTKNNDKLCAEKVVIDFPALGEIYYAEKGKGAFIQRTSTNITGVSRLRISASSNIDQSITSISTDVLKQNIKSIPNIRIFGSHLSSLAYLIRGKIDSIIAIIPKIALQGVQLFIQEAGGTYSTKDDYLIASNFNLHAKIKNLFL